MAHFWMDISRDDDGSVMSVVAGCDACAIRTAGNDLIDAKFWIRSHSKAHHNQGESEAIHYIGDDSGKGDETYGATALRLLATKDSITTQELAKAVASQYNPAFMALKRLHKQGLISKTKAGNAVLWSAA